MEVEIFQYLGGTVTAITDAFVTPAAARLMGILRGFALAGVTIYVMLMGMSIMLGVVDAPARRSVIKALLISAIISIALTVNFYFGFVVDTFQDIETGLADAMGQGGGGVYATLDATLARGLELASICFQRAGDASGALNPFGGAGWFFAALVLCFCTTFILAVGGAAIVAAKLLLAICFALGPLFVLLLIWPVTSRFTMSWVSACLNYTLVIVVTSLIMSFAIVAFNAIIGNDITDEVNPVVVMGEVFALTVFLVYVLRQAYGLAASLSGGLSLSPFSITDTTNALTKPLSVARNTVDAQSQRRDPQSGQLVNARRHSHLLDGRTAFNPAYRQHVMQNVGKNWGRTQGGNVKQGTDK